MSLLKRLKVNDNGLIVTSAYELLSASQKAKLCNGMGSVSTWWNRLLYKLIPNHFFGLDMEECGNIHDFMYYTGGTLWDKVVADVVFLFNMLRTIYHAGKTHRVKRYLMATRYFLAVFWAGKSSFNKK